MDHGHLVDEITRRARNAANRMAELDSDAKDGALLRSADRLEHQTARLIAANARDLEAGRERGLPADSVQLVAHTDREIGDLLLQREDQIDLVVPRGGEGLIRRVTERSRIPVIKHYKGVCHVYLDEAADPKLARDITVKSKCQRVSVCNSAETLLVHAALADQLLPDLISEMQGLGAEIGVSTTRMHWYGPMGLEGLTTQKFVVFGNGQVRE